MVYLKTFHNTFEDSYHSAMVGPCSSAAGTVYLQGTAPGHLQGTDAGTGQLQRTAAGTAPVHEGLAAVGTGYLQGTGVESTAPVYEGLVVAQEPVEVGQLHIYNP